jgi:phosphoglycolate phosphatase/pyrophosphatase PpaX
MRFESVIFDRDGTLYDSLEVILQAFAFGIQPFVEKLPTREEMIRAFGPAEPEVLAKFIPIEKKQASFNRFYDYYRQHFSEIHFYPGIRELLFRLKEKGAKLMLFTGGGRVSTHFCLEQTGILHLFDALICGEDVQHPKPDPEGILKLVQEQHLDLTKSIVVGDAASDVQAGKAAGISAAWLCWSVNAKATPPKVQPDYICDSVKDLEQVLLQEERS